MDWLQVGNDWVRASAVVLIEQLPYSEGGCRITLVTGHTVLSDFDAETMQGMIRDRSLTAKV